MKKLSILNITATLFVLSLLGGCNSEPDNTPVTGNIPVQAAVTADSITVSGVVESVVSRNVYTTLGFMVDRVYVREGDRVTEGQPLAMLDTADLALTIASQRAAIDQARRTSQSSIQDVQRKLNEATANLANNTNIHVLSAEASLNAATINLEASQQSYDNALRDYALRINPQILSAKSLLETARLDMDAKERSHANSAMLYAAGALPQDELRQSEIALTHARNQYNDARISYENAVEFQQRSLEQLRTSLQSAIVAQQSAQEMLNASRIAAQQDIERLRGNLASTEAASNLEHMEIALQQLKRHLEDSIITAPISGTVTAVVAREGAVGMGLMFVVEDTDNLRIITSFREYDLARIKTGMEVNITSDATGSTEYAGIITRINPSATPSAPVVEFEAEVAVTSVSTDLRIGMTTRLDINLE